MLVLNYIAAANVGGGGGSCIDGVGLYAGGRRSTGAFFGNHGGGGGWVVGIVGKRCRLLLMMIFSKSNFPVGRRGGGRCRVELFALAFCGQALAVAVITNKVWAQR